MKFGLSRPVIAEWKGNKQYANGFVCGEAITTEVNPTYAEGKLEGDNRVVINRKKFTHAAVTMGTTRLPKQAAPIIFGHQLMEDGQERSKVTDESRYVGYGFISKEQDPDGSIKHIAVVLYKVMFADSNNSYQTEGDNITFNTPSLSGTAIGDDDGDWCTKKPFETEDAAFQWIKGILGITEKCRMPEASVAAGTYDAAQSVLLTAADGGTIYFTTNGTTPGKTNGTKATSTPIAISQTTMLRAVNTANGKADSDIFSAEYIINA